MEPWEREMLRELRDPICRCGRPKIKGHSKAAFCYGCWKLLPAQIKRALFREFGSGPLSYQEARIAAGDRKIFLRKNIFPLDQKHYDK